MKNLPVSFFHPFTKLSEEQLDRDLEEYAAAEVHYLSIPEVQTLKFAEEPGSALKFLKKLARFGLETLDAHGIWGGVRDLNSTTEKEIREHLVCMEECASIGIKNYTVHIGAQMCYHQPDSGWYGHEDSLRSHACRTLERMLPLAEKLGLILCVENSFEPSNTPQEVLYYIRKFNSPYVQCCFDEGHAHVMDSDLPGRMKREDGFYQTSSETHWREMSWRQGVVLQSNKAALELLKDHIVTCHLHDNDGEDDQHNLIFKGTTDWSMVMEVLNRAPRLLSIQSEASVERDNISPIASAESFRKLMIL